MACALVRAHTPGGAGLDAHAAEEAAAGARDAVGPGVVLHVGPDRGLLVAPEYAVALPALEQLPGVRVAIFALVRGLRQVDRDDVVWRAIEQLRTPGVTPWRPASGAA